MMVMTIQIIVYFPIYKVDFPANTLIFLDALRKIAECKIIEPDKLIQKYLLPIVVQKTNKGELTDSYKDAGFDSFDVMTNI